MFGRSKKNILILVQKIGNQYREIDRVKFKKEEELVSNKKHTIPIPPKNPYIFSTNKNDFLFFDSGNKKYLTFEETDLGLNTEFLEELFGEKMVNQLVKAVKKAEKKETTGTDWIKQILLYAGLVLIGYLLGVQFGGV